MVTPTLLGLRFHRVSYLESIIISSVALTGIDLSKHSFHTHGQDNVGREILRKKAIDPDNQVSRSAPHRHRAL